MSATLRFSTQPLAGVPGIGGLLARLQAPGRARPRVEPRFDRRAADRHSRGTWPQAAEPLPGNLDLHKLLAAAKSAPELALLEWDGDRSLPVAPVEGDAPRADAATAGDMRLLDPRRRKIRDRYVGARFPGVARSCQDLASVDRVIKAARLYFEEEDVETALELLQLAVEEAPHESALWLARLEILFLARDAQQFAVVSRGFAEMHPAHEAWPEVLRLGRALLPDDPLFASLGGPRDHEHYGPWPHLPNWIRAPWDLTSEVAAVDFHRAMRSAGTPSQPAA